MTDFENKQKQTSYSINPIVFEGGVKCQMILAHMGAGKSHASIDFIKSDAAAA